MDRDGEHSDLKVLSAIGLLVALYVTVATAQGAFYGLKGEQAQETTATIIDTRRSKGFRSWRFSSSAIIYEIEYQAEFGNKDNNTYIAEIAKPKRHSFVRDKGNRMNVFYFPSNPEKPYYDRKHPSQALFLFIAGLALLIFSA